jgi:SNF2 family DNA or RNA helicase
MGLGKTVQVSVLIRCLQRTQGLRDTVIIAPHSLLKYWESEYKRWLCPGIITHIWIVRSRNENFINDKFMFGSRVKRIIIMTSDAFDNFKHMLEKNLQVDLLVIDEGHKAKNVDTKLRKAVKAFNVG